MTYGLAMMTDHGIAFMIDSRSNAGLDIVATFQKMFVWGQADKYNVTTLLAGNLATTQSVVSRFDEITDQNSFLETHNSMFKVASTIGRIIRESYKLVIDNASDMNVFGVTAILGGQVLNDQARLYQIFKEGNFIEATDDTPFLGSGLIDFTRRG